MRYSTKWKLWKSTLDLKTCLSCRKNNGKIYEISQFVYPSPPLHSNCRCVIERMFSLIAGTATDNGTNGADWFLKRYWTLPNYYITKEDAEMLGYKSY